jgi:hypothetical protein
LKRIWKTSNNDSSISDVTGFSFDGITSSPPISDDSETVLTSEFLVFDDVIVLVLSGDLKAVLLLPVFGFVASAAGNLRNLLNIELTLSFEKLRSEN